MSEDQTYNGWKNYPTWNVALWIDNERNLYEESRGVARNLVTIAPQDENTVSGIWTADQTAKYRLADFLKLWVTDDLAPDLGASFAADLLGYALGEVDWEEIASSILEEINES